jgi:hypothetical protein
MSTLFSRRAAGLSCITASALILLYQFAQIILVLTVSEPLFNATQSIRFGLALIAEPQLRERPAPRRAAAASASVRTCLWSES